LVQHQSCKKCLNSNRLINRIEEITITMNLSFWGKLKEEVKSDFDLWTEGKCKDGGKEKYCRLCEKREKRGTCGYGGAMWDKYTVNDVSDSEKAAAAEESGITGDGGDGGGGGE